VIQIDLQHLAEQLAGWLSHLLLRHFFNAFKQVSPRTGASGTNWSLICVLYQIYDIVTHIIEIRNLLHRVTYELVETYVDALFGLEKNTLAVLSKRRVQQSDSFRTQAVARALRGNMLFTVQGNR
jgi:hypothetical protein